MASEKSICFTLNEPNVEASHRQQRDVRRLVADDCGDDDMITLGQNGKGQWNNLALGSVDFKHIPSQLITSSIKHSPRVGDVCVRLMPIASQSEEYSSFVDLYNTYIAKGSALIAKMFINNYAGTEELYIPAIPIHIFVSEWNKSLYHFHNLIRCDGLSGDRTPRQRRLAVISNVTELAFKNVPIVSEHLWFVVHSIVSKPCLVKQVVQLVGSIASTSGTLYHTGEVQNTTVPGHDSIPQAGQLYLVAKSVPASGNNVTVLGAESGVTLGLIWAADEDELYDHLRDSRGAYYLHVGTESGNTFRCNGFCDWRYYNHAAFDRMIAIGQDTVSKFCDSMLAGNTGDSARLVNKA